MFIAILSCTLIGYIIGGINPAFILARLKGFDIRSKGSGNAGASNAVIVMGKKTGVFCALFDIFKAYCAVKLTIKLFPILKTAGIIAGACCILGHMFPAAMEFHGGKGLASLGGMILAYDKRLFITMLFFEILFVLLTRYICTVATSASQIFSVILFFKDGIIPTLIMLPVVYAIMRKHKNNFKRIRYGVEARINFLWNKEAEETRLRANWEKLTEEERSLIDLPALSAE